MCSKDQAKLWLELTYPVTIISDRYSGTYSGGLFVAFPENYTDLPGTEDEGPDGDDVDCMMFWKHYDAPYGIGSTPNQAFENLVQKMKNLLNEK